MPEYAAIKSENRRPLETIDLLGEKDLLFEPGSQFAYSSSG